MSDQHKKAQIKSKINWTDSNFEILNHWKLKTHFFLFVLIFQSTNNCLSFNIRNLVEFSHLSCKVHQVLIPSIIRKSRGKVYGYQWVSWVSMEMEATENWPFFCACIWDCNVWGSAYHRWNHPYEMWVLVHLIHKWQITLHYILKTSYAKVQEGD